MSMSTYPVYIVGLLIDDELGAYCWRALDARDGEVPPSISAMNDEEFVAAAKAGTLPEDYGCPMDLGNENVGHFCSDFDGRIETMFPERAITPIELDAKNEYVSYIEAEKAADLFSAAYESPEALLQSFKDSLSWVDIPEDFDWWGHLVEISGTVFC